mgnify:FL=1
MNSSELDLLLQKKTIQKGEHLIWLPKFSMCYFQGKRVQASYLRFMQKHGRSVQQDSMLKKLEFCSEPFCIEHFVELLVIKRKRKEESDEDVIEPKRRKLTELTSEHKLFLLDRMAKKCVKGTPKTKVEEECLLWTGFTEKNGEYGRISIGQKMYLVHRAAYQLHFGVEPMDNQHIRHLCGNRTCIRKEHLAVGDAFENAQDKIASGTLPIGANNPKAKLTKEQVLFIYNNPQISPSKCSEMFSVSNQVADSIRRGRTWSHVTGLAKVPRVIKKRKIGRASCRERVSSPV